MDEQEQNLQQNQPTLTEGDRQTAPVDSELQELKSKLQAANERLSKVEGEADFYRQMMKQSFTQEEEPPQVQRREEPIVDVTLPNDYVMGPDVEKYVRTTVERKVGEVQRQYENALRQRVIKESQKMARRNYSDFEDVIKTYTSKAIQEDPNLLMAIENSDDPADLAYKIGTNREEYKKTKQAEQANSNATTVLSQIRATNPNPTLTNVGGQAPTQSRAKSFKDMSDDEIEAHYQKVLFGGR